MSIIDAPGACSESPGRSEQWLERLDRFFDRLPWLLPLAGFSAGWLNFLLVQRGGELARLIAATVLAGWVWLLAQPFLINRLRKRLSRRHLFLLSNFVSQSIQQEILFFSLPFLLFSTSVESPGQILFTASVFLLALLSTLDPLYEKYIAADRVSSLTFHSLCSFVSALVILPVAARIPEEKAFLVSLSIVLVWLFATGPLLYRRLSDKQGIAVLLLAIVFIPSTLFAFRDSIPPAGLEISEAVMTNMVSNHEPGSAMQVYRESELEQGVYAYAAIIAPSGLTQDIIFVWQHDSYYEEIVSTITGGRESGYRTYAVKDNFIPDALGEWVVDITTPQGQLLERLSFEVVAD